MDREQDGHGGRNFEERAARDAAPGNGNGNGGAGSEDVKPPDGLDPAATAPTNGFTRRQFLGRAGIVAGSAVLGGGMIAGLAGCTDDEGDTAGTTETSEGQNGASGAQWDDAADVLVVGSGAAAYGAAAAAVNAGAEVVMLEKGTAKGGTSYKSGGGYWIPNNHLMQAEGIDDPRDEALQYMARLSYPQFYDPQAQNLGIPQHKYDLITNYYDRGSEIIRTMDEIGALRSMISPALRPDIHPLPYTPDYHAQLEIDVPKQGRQMNPTDGAGAAMIEQLAAYADEQGVRLMLEHRVTRILRNDQGEVEGLEVETPDGTQRFQARQGVVFGSGGFTQNPDMRLAYLRGPIFGGCAVPTIEGDFVHMANDVGAQFGNMQNGWWAEVELQTALDNPSVPNDIWIPYGHSMVMVNRHGTRVTNEKQVYNERTQVHFYWDPVELEYPNLVMMMIYDSKVAQDDTEWGFRYPVPMPGEERDYVIQGQTWQELADNINSTLGGYSEQLGGWNLVDDFAQNLQQTVEQFNQFAEQGQDPVFHRGETPIQQDWSGPPLPPEQNAMAPFEGSGPYYCILLGGGTLDTKGGPEININAEVLDAEGNPIPGLYGAGNCISSPAAQAYWSGGSTLGPALVYGWIAGENAAGSAAGSGATESTEPVGTTAS